MKKTLLLTTVFFLASVANLRAQQDYRTAAGGLLLGPGGPSPGITLKHFLNEKTGLEGMVIYRWRGINAVFLYERHGKFHNKKLRHLRRLNWYLGGGVHFSHYGQRAVGDALGSFFQITTPFSLVGADVVVGLEYKITAAPLAFCLYYKPAFNIAAFPTNGLRPDNPGGHKLWQDEIGISVKYIIIGY